MFSGQSSEFTDRSDSVRQRIGRPDRLPRLHARAARLGLAILLGVGAVASGAQAQTLPRGPYLQLGTPTSIVVRWRTDQWSDSVVRYGTSLSSLSQSAASPTATKEHEVVLGGLAPGTRYYYSVGSSGAVLAGGDGDHSFVTAPLAGATEPVRVWVLGDSGSANADADAVRDAFDQQAGARIADLWLMLGDNAYPEGTDAEYQAAVFDTYPAQLRRSVLWPSLGNHDARSPGSADSTTQTGPYYDIFTLPRAAEAGGVPSKTEAYYSFDFANVHFVALNSFDSDRSPGGPMLTWLAQDLAANTQNWTIAFWHHPPHNKGGSHDSDTEVYMVEMRENALPILESYDVDLVLTGHGHSYTRSFLIDGHYGPHDTYSVAAMLVDGGDGQEDGGGAYAKSGLAGASWEGVVYAIAGSSGKLSSNPRSYPSMHRNIMSLGSMMLDVYGGRLDATFHDDCGRARDDFTILKGADTLAPALVVVEPLDETYVRAHFAEPLDPATAEDPNSYTLDGGATVLGASLAPDGRSVLLETMILQEGTTYLLTANGVEDRSGNATAPGTGTSFGFETRPRHSIAGVAMALETKGNKKFVYATARISVDNGAGQPVPGATVVVAWDGLAEGRASGVTGADGTATLASDKVPSSQSGRFLLTVCRASVPGSRYDALANFEAEACIDTAGASCRLPSANTLPVAVDDAVTTPPETPIAVDVLANDSDADGDLLYVGKATQGDNGSVTVEGGIATYKPDNNFTGDDSFIYALKDGNGGHDTATVRVRVGDGGQGPANNPPTANEQGVATNEDVPLSITLTGSDPDSEDTLTYSVVGGPTNGSLSGTAPNLTYTPDPNFFGSDSFTFTANDGTVVSAPATVSITVNPVNDAPVADAQSVTTAEGTAVAITLAGSDVDGDPLTYAVVTGPANGSLSGSAPNLTYTPNADFSGADALTFVTNDGSVDSDLATVSIDVTGASTGDSNALYVWDSVFVSRTRGKGGAMHDERVTATIRRDSDADGVQEATDAVANNVQVMIELGNSTGMIVGSAIGTTNGEGVFRTNFFGHLADETYLATVTVLSLDPFSWNQSLDLPDQEHIIPH